MIKRGLFVVLISLLIISGCSKQNINTGVSIGNNVVINGFSFNPNELSVKIGDTITWENQDSAVHTVVSNGLFESEVLNKGEKFSFTFDKAGEYNYNCGIHPSMRGKIIVG
ncbi:cupredoxin family copper-binding protein [Candidatus Woesearchaeota archaeon]|nr:cupredoxin family copper-binding protein [Candidatus Woesearchaeota archaeon]